jgi:hypothetical protein
VVLAKILTSMIVRSVFLKGSLACPFAPVRYLQFCLKQIVADNELGGLLEALNGR